MPITRLENPRIYRQIADQLRGLIERGEFPPGSRLPAERELAKQLQVSRASVREALIALEVVGLVDVKVGNGVVVKALPKTTMPSRTPRQPWQEMDSELNIDIDFNAELAPFSVLQARRLIEPETAALAARNASSEQLLQIRAAFEQNCKDNRANSQTHPGDRLFHIRIAQASGNQTYGFIIGQLLGHRYGTMFRTLQQRFTPEDMPHRSEQEHLQILEALEARDSRRARQAMKAHLDQVIAIFSRA
ncbi:FadR/GntR family transcriptional regulator [Pantoea sp. MQR6]|uniref:FadR/GntR family transcriptional regulator n=1 Tax=Pantoea sp. MQR6 TaxID=2907307 RepID=UPI001FAA0208|nr:FadR/GntR family transcriptional regulator [Pantoea sp. MQR6]